MFAPQVLDAQGAAIDGVSSATVTSDAVRAAVRNALDAVAGNLGNGLLVPETYTATAHGANMTSLYYNGYIEPIPALISVIIADNKLITGTRIGDMVRIPQRHRATLCSRYYKNYAKSVRLERAGMISEARKNPDVTGLLRG